MIYYKNNVVFSGKLSSVLEKILHLYTFYWINYVFEKKMCL